MNSAIAIPPYTNNSSIYLIPVTLLGAIALVLVILRIYTRVARTRRLHLDDWLIIVGEVRLIFYKNLSYIDINLGTFTPQCPLRLQCHCAWMGQTYGICHTGWLKNGTQDAIRNAAIVAFCSVLHTSIDSSIATSLWIRQMVDLYTLFHDGSAMPDHNGILRYPAWAVQTYLRELGNSSWCEMLADDSHY